MVERIDIPDSARRGGRVGAGHDDAGNVAILIKDEAGVVIALAAVSPDIARRMSADLLAEADQVEVQHAGGVN